jgi:hypothetical protein
MAENNTCMPYTEGQVCNICIYSRVDNSEEDTAFSKKAEMQKVYFSETLVPTYRTVWRHNEE